MIRAAGATRVGSRHRMAGENNQDAYLYRVSRDQRTLVAAVSDGAGSAGRSRLGSFTAVRHAVHGAYVETERGASVNDALRAGLKQAIKAIGAQGSRDQSGGVSAYHCTLILAVWQPGRLGAIQVGDGAAVVATPEGTKMLTVPQRGEYANETYFITLPRADEIAFVNQTAAATALALFTDGLHDQAIDFPNRRPVAGFVEAALAGSSMVNTKMETGKVISGSWMKEKPEQDLRLEEWLASESAAATNIDDSTLITATWAGHDN